MFHPDEPKEFIVEVYELPTPYFQKTGHHETIEEITSPMFTVQRASGRSKKPKVAPPSNPLRKFKCRYELDGVDCNWSFATPAKRKRHEATHYQIGSFKCQLCDTAIKHMYNMYVHWRTVCKEFSEYTDVEKNQLKPAELKKHVIKRMTKMNKFNDFADFGGMVFVPSEQFLLDVSEKSEMCHKNNCHVCGLSVPLKFYKAHSLAHRGFLKVDADVGGRFVCHLCGFAFGEIAELHGHWRNTCAEVLAHLQADVPLNGQELAALVFLLLQQSVPQYVANQMAREDSYNLKVLAADEQKRAKLDTKDTLFHFPRGVVPLCGQIDVYGASEPILQQLKPPSEFPTLQEKINKFAMSCPSYFSSRKQWVIFKDPETFEAKRRVLQYYNHMSIMKNYKITNKSIPVINTTPNSQDWQAGIDRKCDRCDIYFTSVGKLNYHVKTYHTNQAGTCTLCDAKKSTVDGLIDHWRKSCEVMKAMFPNEDLRQVNPSKLQQFAFSMSETVFSMDLDTMNKQIFELRTKVVNSRTPHGFKVPPETLNKMRSKPSILRKNVPKASDVQKCCYCEKHISVGNMHRHLINEHDFDPNSEPEIRHILANNRCATLERRKVNLDFLKATRNEMNGGPIVEEVYEYEHGRANARLATRADIIPTKDLRFVRSNYITPVKVTRKPSPEPPNSLYLTKCPMRRRNEDAERQFRMLEERAARSNAQMMNNVSEIEMEMEEQEQELELGNYYGGQDEPVVVVDVESYEPTSYYQPPNEQQQQHFVPDEYNQQMEYEQKSETLSGMDQRNLPTAHEGLHLEDDGDINQDQAYYVNEYRHVTRVQPNTGSMVPICKNSRQTRQAEDSRKSFGNVVNYLSASQNQGTSQPRPYYIKKVNTNEFKRLRQNVVLAPPAQLTTERKIEELTEAQKRSYLGETGREPKFRVAGMGQLYSREQMLMNYSEPHNFEDDDYEEPCVLQKSSVPTAPTRIILSTAQARPVAVTRPPMPTAQTRAAPPIRSMVQTNLIDLEHNAHFQQLMKDNPDTIIRDIFKSMSVPAPRPFVRKIPPTPAKNIPIQQRNAPRRPINIACNETLPNTARKNTVFGKTQPPRPLPTTTMVVKKVATSSTTNQVSPAVQSTSSSKPVKANSAEKLKGNSTFESLLMSDDYSKDIYKKSKTWYHGTPKLISFEPGAEVDKAIFRDYTPKVDTSKLKTGLSALDAILKAAKETVEEELDDTKIEMKTIDKEILNYVEGEESGVTVSLPTGPCRVIIEGEKFAELPNRNIGEHPALTFTENGQAVIGGIWPRVRNETEQLFEDGTEFLAGVQYRLTIGIRKHISVECISVYCGRNHNTTLPLLWPVESRHLLLRDGQIIPLFLKNPQLGYPDDYDTDEDLP